LELTHDRVKGWVVVGSDAARALLQTTGHLDPGRVISCAGEFQAGDAIYLVARNIDGGQRVVAMAIAQCGSSGLGAAAPPVEAALTRTVLRGDMLIPL
jgi:glutamate 5-kinase